MNVLNMRTQKVVQQIFIMSLSVRHYSRWQGHCVQEKLDQKKKERKKN